MERTAPIVVGDVHPAIPTTADPTRVVAGRNLLLMIGPGSGEVGVVQALTGPSFHRRTTGELTDLSTPPGQRTSRGTSAGIDKEGPYDRRD